MLALLLAACLASLSGCANLGAPPAPAWAPPATVSADEIFASSDVPAEVEWQHLAAAQTAPALLRRAWLELQQQRTQDALDSTARVIFTEPPPSGHVESFARFLRAEAYRIQGHAQRGRFDRERARELAMDPGLKRRLRAEARPQPRAGARARGGANTPWGNLAVQRRSAWQPKRENRRDLDRMQRPRKVTIHHSAMYFRSTAPRMAAAQIARIQREHMDNRGYGDIGYHFLIDPSGRIWEGRQLRWQGAHASGSNNIANIGVCLLGNFMRRGDGQGPTRDQVRAMERLVVNLMQHYGMRGDALYCHSDFKSTACPGQRMTPIVKQFARQLRARGYLALTEEEDE
ncbi:MAG: peptidoglycan recognition family protein [Planctomycetota bacterium]